MITHDLGVARLISDRIHVMKDGSFVESGDVQQIVEHPATEYTRSLLAAVPVLGPWDETPAGTTDTKPTTAMAGDAALTSTGGQHD
jgi:peptide/nickel transport system ATP-binding protein